MIHPIEIDDLSRPELDVFARLTEAQLRSKQEPEKGIFIAESPKVIELALNAGCEPLALLMERSKIDGPARDLVRRCADVPLYTADREVLASLTGFALTRGVLCAMRRPPMRSPEDVCRGARRLAVLEGIADASNVGAIFRSAAALDVDAILLDATCCDPLRRRAARVSMGTVFQIPWARMKRPWPGEGLARLRAAGFCTAALALTEQSLTIEDPRLAAADKLALVLGTEGDGLRPETIAACDWAVRIPMSHGVDSLNVAAAAALAFWQTRPCRT